MRCESGQKRKMRRFAGEQGPKDKMSGRAPGFLKESRCNESIVLQLSNYGET